MDFEVNTGVDFSSSSDGIPAYESNTYPD